jgi:holo-[acyl-carrier protein] synthase
MIEQIGIGIDITDITDFEKIPYDKKSNFYKKLFLPSEIKYCLKFRNPSIHFAGKFATKEAVKKSLNKKITMLKIHTDHINSKPSVSLIETKNKFKFLVSLSHEKNFAIAVVISESLK